MADTKEREIMSEAEMHVTVTVKGPLPIETKASELVGMLEEHLRATMEGDGYEVQVRLSGGASILRRWKDEEEGG